jgi:hypothetical protein
MPRRAGRRRLHRAPPREKIEAGQHARGPQRRHHLTWLRGWPFLWQFWLLLRLGGLGRLRRRLLSRRCLCATHPGASSGLIEGRGTAATTLQHPRQLHLTADAGKALDPFAIGVLHEVERVLEEEEVFERNSALLVENKRHRTVYRLGPAAQFVGVAHRGGETGEEHMFRRMDDRLLPDRAAFRIGEEMELIEDDAADAREIFVDISAPGHLCHIRGLRHAIAIATSQGMSTRPQWREQSVCLVVRRQTGRARAFEQHIAVDLSGHDDDGRGGVLDDIAGQQPNLTRAVALAQVAELLIRERLDWRGIDRALPGTSRLPDGKLCHDCFSNAGRSRHQHRAPRRQMLRCLDLKRVQREGLRCHEVGDRRGGLARCASRVRCVWNVRR